MRKGAEFFFGKRLAVAGNQMMEALIEDMLASDRPHVKSYSYVGYFEWLVLFGVGALEHDKARQRHLMAGGKVLVWDMGYFGRGKTDSFLRFSINADHPQRLLDDAPLDASRLEAQVIQLREDYDPDGHIVLAGMGRKQRAYLGDTTWELRKLAELRKRFPGVRILYKPKKARSRTPGEIRLDCPYADSEDTIEDVIRGARLVVCRHSNVAVDAAIAGVPYEAEDGAAMWLSKRAFTKANRLEFLKRLAWFNWHPREAGAAWQFISNFPLPASPK